MSAGDFYIRRNNAEVDIIGDLGSIDAGWDTLVHDEGSIVSYTDPNLQLDIGTYLIMYSEHFMSDSPTNNERVEVQGEIQAGGSAVGGYSQDYIRKSSGVGQDAALTGQMIYEVTSDNTDIKIHFYRTDTSQDATGVHRVAGFGGISILELDDTDNFGFYSNSAAQTLSGNTEVDIVLNTNDRQDTGFSRTGNAVTISTAGRYLAMYSMRIVQTGTGREDCRGHLEVGTTKIPGTTSYTYLRGDTDENCDDGALTWAGIIDVSASDVITGRYYSFTSLPGSITAGTLSMQFWQIPSAGDEAIIEATTGDFNADATFSWDTQPHLDSSFSYTNGESNVDVNQDDHLLVFASVSNDVADTPQRAIPRLTLTKDGADVTHATASVYHRNSASGGVAVNIGTIVDHVPSGSSIEMDTYPLEATGSLTNDSGQFSFLSLSSLHTYTINLPPTVTDVDTDEVLGNTQTNVVITGTYFEAVKGTGIVELVENSNYTGTKITQSTDSWADTSIQFDVTAGALANTFCFLFVTTDSGLRAYIDIQLGLPPETYQQAVEGMTLSPSHFWRFQNSYDDEIGTATANNSSGGTPTFVTSPLLCRFDTHSLLLDSETDYISPADQTDMNTSSQNRRYIGGWFQLDSVSQTLSVIYEEGAQVNNIALLNGFGNNAMFQIANAADDYIQTYFDYALAKNRPYHVLLKFVASGYDSGVCALYLDGVLQARTNGNPWETPQLDSHSGNISWGHEASESLKVGDDRGVDATTIAFVSPTSCNYSNWYNWSGVILNVTTDIRETLFEKGATAAVIIDSDTEANMQTDLDTYADTVRPDWPCAIEIEELSGGGDFELTLDNITFNTRCSIDIRYMGVDTLTLVAENGSSVDEDKIAVPYSGIVNVQNPATFTVNGLINGCEIRIYDDNGNGTTSDFGTELSGTETLSGTSHQYAHDGTSNDIVVQMIAGGYEESVIPYTLSSSDQTLTFIPKYDANE